MHRISVIVLFLVLTLACESQSIHFINYTSEHGLPSSEVYDVMQDRQGYIWTATDRGLARFDGYKFISYTTKKGLSANVVFKMEEAPDGKIWFAELNGTLSYLQGDTIIKAVQNNKLKQIFRTINTPLSLTAWGDSVYVGYSNCGIYKIFDDRLTELTKDSSGYMIRVINGDAVFGAKRETPYLKIEDKRKLSVAIEPFNRKFYSRMYSFKRRNGDLLTSINGKVWTVKPDGRIIKYEVGENTAFFETRDSCLYSAGYWGFRRFNPNEDFYPDKGPRYLEHAHITDIFDDVDGGLWVGTRNKGLFYGMNPNFLIYDFPSTLEGRSLVYSLCGNGREDVFVGFENGVIYNFNVAAEPLVRRLSPPQKSMLGCFLGWDSDKNVLLLWSEHPLGEIDTRFFPVKKIGSHMHGFAVYKNGQYLIGSYRGLSLVDKNFENAQGLFQTAKLNVECMAQISERDIFIGTFAGLYRLKDSTLLPLLRNTAYESERINDIEILSDHQLALATMNKGILIFNTVTGDLANINSRHGLLSDVINDLTVDTDGVIWAASPLGLSKLEFGGKSPVIYNYTSDNGLPVSEVRKVYACKNIIFMGTANGLILFRKQKDRKERDPGISLRSVQVNGYETGLSDLSNLDFSANNIQISYLSVIPKMHGRITYRYKLMGSVDRWIHTSDTHVFLPSVKPGTYTLVVQASNASGQWSSRPLYLPIHIFPPFWKTWWFMILCSLLLVTLAVVFFIIRLKHQRELIKNEKIMLDYQQHALLNQIKPHFVFNSMNSIQKYILREDKEKAVFYVAKFAKLIRLSFDLSRKRYVSVAEEIELLEIYLSLEAKRFSRKFDYDIHLSEELNHAKLKLPTLLIQPFVENAIKHGLLNKIGKGHVSVKLYMNNGLLYCEIEDNGIGRQAAEKIKESDHGIKHLSSGLIISSERLSALSRAMNTRFFLNITDKFDNLMVPSGTLVKLIIPYKS